MTAGPRPPSPPTPPPAPAGRGRPAALLGLLARHPDHVVSVPHLVEALWPGVDPATGRARLHVVASRVRRRLPSGTTLETVGDGYRLVGVDAGRAGELPGVDLDDVVSDGPAPLVARETALALLPAAGAMPLVVVSAPTGFGKTALLRRWSGRQADAIDWVDLAAEADPAAALDAALGVVLAGADRRPGRQGPAALIVEGLDHAGPVDLAPRVEAVVRRRSPITLVLVSRRALPLATGPLVVRGDAVALGPDDLVLTAAEADVLRPGDGAGLVRLTGGWPEAVARLAAVPDPAAPAAAAALAPLGERIRAGLPPELVALLDATAPLDHIRPALADAVADRPRTATDLAALADRYHLLVREGDGYVHRPLVRLLLRSGPADGEIRRGHLRAARWHLRQGEPEPALSHAAAAPDLPTVRAVFAPAVRSAARRGDAATLLAWTTAVRPPSHRDAAAVALAVWALAPSPGGDRWRPTPDAPRAVTAAARAVDLLGAGSCDAARAAAAEGLAHLTTDGGEDRPIVAAVLHLVEVEAMVLQGHRVPIRRGVLGAQPWPWFVLWGFGIRALTAELAGRRQEAAALIDHGRARAGSPHGSWKDLAPGPWALARALVDLDRSGTPADRIRAVEDLTRLAARLDDRHEPLAVMARHGLHLACHRVGDEEGAARWLAEADDRARSLPDLELLAQSRAALVQRAGRAPLGGLSAQERQVLGYLSTDMALGEIADALFLSPHTVKAHTRSIYRKLRVHSRAEAVDAILQS